MLLAASLSLSGIHVSIMSLGDIPKVKELKAPQAASEASIPKGKGFDILINRSADFSSFRDEQAKAQALSDSDTFISGIYTGCLGYWNLWVPQAVFKRQGESIEGWMILVHDDFVVKQFFSGKVVLDIGGPQKADYRHIKVELFGTKVEYLKVSQAFEEKVREKPDTFIRQIHYSAFSRDAREDIVVMLGRINYSGLSQEFPSCYYNLYGNFVLTKI